MRTSRSGISTTCLRTFTSTPICRFSTKSSGTRRSVSASTIPGRCSNGSRRAIRSFLLSSALARRGQIEMVGGGFYEPILISIPRADQLEQIQRMREYLRQRFGQAPTGAWLAERVWEPQLPAMLERRRWTIPSSMTSLFVRRARSRPTLGDYIAEECGAKVRVIPGLSPCDTCFLSVPWMKGSRFSATLPGAIRAAWRPWETTAKNLAGGPARMNIATTMDGSTSF